MLDSNTNINASVAQECLDKRKSDRRTGKPSRVQRVKSFAEAEEASAELLSIRSLAEFTEAFYERSVTEAIASRRWLSFTWLLLIYYESAGFAKEPHTRRSVSVL